MGNVESNNYYSVPSYSSSSGFGKEKTGSNDSDGKSPDRGGEIRVRSGVCAPANNRGIMFFY